MPSVPPDLPPDLEAAADRFEEAWESGSRPSIEDYLPSSQHARLLIELVHIDLERRLKAGESARVEEYLHRFPQALGEAAVTSELLAAEFRLRQTREPSLSLEEFAARFPECRTAITALIHNGAPVGSTLFYPSPDPGHGKEEPAAGPGEEIATMASYRVLQAHARGGLGAIVLARDEQLQREVALKLLLPDQARSAEARRRFLWEARITSQLEHPGVVPLYGLGTATGGSPVYAMRFIRGESLQEAIARHHAPKPYRPESDHVTFRQLLTRFITVCNTIAYAHSRGVLHRDIKPGNIMLGEYGETLVVDWGLAKLFQVVHQDRPAVKEEHQPTLETLAPPSPLLNGQQAEMKSAEDSRTQAGCLLGTPAYMSPEQARGDWDHVGSASDVYSLGATLYVLLTGKQPFQDTPRDNLLARVRAGDFPPPRSQHRHVAPALEAICLKAMAHRPEDRYSTALALAGDIEHWLADEPVGPYAEPLTTRLRRWTAQHATLVASLVVATIAASCLAVVVTLLMAANDRERSARIVAQVHDEENRRNLRQAARDFYFHRIYLANREWWNDEFERTQKLLAECKEEPLRRWEWHYLQRRCQASLSTLSGHQEVVWSVAFIPDGNRLLSASLDGTVRVWDVQSGKVLYTFKNHTGAVWGLALHPAGRWAASGGADRMVRLWDITSGEEIRCFAVPAGEVHSLAFSPDGAKLSAACVAGFRERGPVKGLREQLVWDTQTAREIWAIQAQGDGAHSVAFSPLGKWLCLGKDDGTICIRDAGTGAEKHSLKVQLPPGLTPAPVFGVTYSPDGSTIASCGGDGWVRLWDAETGMANMGLRGHAGPAWGVAFRPDGKRLASCSDDHTIRIWDVALGRTFLVLHGHQRGIANVVYSPDGSRLASASDDQTVRIWDADQRRDDRYLLGHTKQITALAIHPDSKRLASADEDRNLKIWDLAAGRVERTLNVGASVTALGFNPKGELLVSADAEGALTLWDSVTWEPQEVLRGPASKVLDMAFSPDGRYLASAAEDGTIKLWDCAGRKEWQTLRGHVGKVNAVVFHPEGRLLYSAGEDRSIHIWDVATGQEIQALPGHAATILTLAISPDGQRLASGSASAMGALVGDPGEVRIWDLASVQEVMALHGQLSDVNSLAFHPEGSRLVAALGEGRLKLWEPSRDQEVLTLNDYQGAATCVRFSPDGKWLVSGGGNGSIIIRNGECLVNKD